MTAEDKKNLESEILENSVGVWDDTLEFTEDGILLEKLWPILDKYITNGSNKL